MVVRIHPGELARLRTPRSTSTWQFAHSSTHFAASGASPIEASCNAGIREPECLRGRIDVVELEGGGAAIVAAQRAAPACLGDE